MKAIKKTSKHAKAAASRETSRNVPQNLDPNYQKLVTRKHVEREERKRVEREERKRVEREERKRVEQERVEKSKRMFKISDILFAAMNAISQMILSREHQEQVPQDPVFLLNLNHGIVPLKYVENAGKGHPVQMIEYNSNVAIHTKVSKAPMGACPMSNVNSHNDLVTSLISGMSPSGVDIRPEDFHKNVSTIISNPSIPENSDIQLFQSSWFYDSGRGETEKYIAADPSKTYQPIDISQGTSTVNKFFFMEKTEKDGGIYVLRPALVLLPFAPTIAQFTPQDAINNPSNVYPMELYFAGHCSFISTRVTRVMHPTGGYDDYLANVEIFLYMGSRIVIYSNDDFVSILSLFPNMNIFFKNGNYMLYPYKTGTKVVKHGVEYVGYVEWTDILSCPYFIYYFQLMIRNSTTTSGLELFESDFISTCTSLLHPYEHETVIAISSIILTNYFRNSSHLYTYDFTCQAFELVDSGGSTKQLHQIIHDSKGNQKALYEYAKGTTKRKKRKPKKTIKKRKRH